METKFQASFIPKSPIVSTPSATSKAPRSINLIMMLSSIVFMGAVLIAAGLFGYKWYLNSDIKKMEQELVAAQNTIDNQMLDEFLRLDARLASAEDLLAGHMATSLIFEYLQNNTVRTIVYDDFSFNILSSGQMDVMLKGKAGSYNAIALQASLFSRSNAIENPVFSDLTLDTKGDVTFSLKATINPTLVSHKNTLNELTYLLTE